MLRKKTRFLPLLFIITLSLLLSEKAGRGTITAITLTPANPTALSNGLGYYLAGKAYTFTVDVIDPDATAWGDINDIRITITNAVNIVVRNTNPLAGLGAFPVTVVSGTIDATGVVTAGTFNNFTFQFTITFRWDTPESAWAAARNVIASCTTTVPANNTLTDTKIVSYGVRSTVQFLNFSQNGDAADGRINPWHTPFTVSGTIVYNVPGATLADKVYFLNGGAELLSVRLLLDGADTTTLGTPVAADAAFVNDAVTNDVSFAVPAEFMNLNGIALGSRTWTVRAYFTTAGGPDTPTSSLSVILNRIQVNNIEFINGGGTAAVPYYRSVNIPGTQVRVTAQLAIPDPIIGTANMVGNTTIRIEDSSGTPNEYNVLIANGANQGIATLDVAPNNYPAVPGDIPDTTTTQLTYSAVRVYGGAYDGDTAAAEGQDDFAKITQAILGTYYVYWDSNDPPGQNGPPFTPFNPAGVGQTPYSLTLAWTPLTAAAPDLDGDFYTYRVYYRDNTTLPWIIIDRNTGGPFVNLGVIGTASTTITGLQPFTNYDYYISAVDLFGQEVLVANVTYDPLPGPGFGTISTLASLVEVTMTDGITLYTMADFKLNPLVPADRPFRKTALRASLNIVTVAGGSPDQVNIIASPFAGPDLIVGGVVDPVLILNTDYWRLPCTKTAPNIWVGYLPDSVESGPLLNTGSQVKFLVETIKSGIPSYTDTDSDTEVPPGNVNNAPHTFLIASQPTFTPWPTRILNNVITDKNPVAYPAYYLSEDAYVSIKVFDIKGRPVATLLDNAFRKGGQNIKEGGWRGDNKANRKIGVGLYYIQIEAKSVSTGRVILNSFQKVVMAR